MSAYTTRVSLHNATYNDYDGLHKAMEVAGFSRVIRSDDGVWYHLPDAEYDINTSLSVEQVRALARTAANSTGRQNAVLVTEATRRAWIGLNAVQVAHR